MRSYIGALIELHVLSRAARENISGLKMIEELKLHGYRISLGTLYPLLNRLTRGGYLSARQPRQGRASRRLYRATQKGRHALVSVHQYIRELNCEFNKGACHQPRHKNQTIEKIMDKRRGRSSGTPLLDTRSSESFGEPHSAPGSRVADRGWTVCW
jgi:DNA-binding PadR family transcriptional regulator